MTKKDYITIAGALKPFYKEKYRAEDYTPDEWTTIEIVLSISKALKADNPRFNPVKFLDYLRQ